MKPKYEKNNIIFLSTLVIGMILCAGSIVIVFVFRDYYTDFWASVSIFVSIFAMFVASSPLRHEFKIFYRTYKMRK